MPDLFLIASPEDAEVLKKHIKTVIGPALRQATANSFEDLKKDPKKVSVYILTHQGGDNIPPLQIVGLASWNEQRERELEGWRNRLGREWGLILSDKKIGRELTDRFSFDKVEIWPLLPKGSFATAAFAAKMFLAEQEWR